MNSIDLLDDKSFEVCDAYEAQSKVAGECGWDDPEMDLYDDYDGNKSHKGTT
jgi:hypothetical protein